MKWEIGDRVLMSYHKTEQLPGRVVGYEYFGQGLTTDGKARIARSDAEREEMERDTVNNWRFPGRYVLRLDKPNPWNETFPDAEAVAWEREIVAE